MGRAQVARNHAPAGHRANHPRKLQSSWCRAVGGSTRSARADAARAAASEPYCRCSRPPSDTAAGGRRPTAGPGAACRRRRCGAAAAWRRAGSCRRGDAAPWRSRRLRVRAVIAAARRRPRCRRALPPPALARGSCAATPTGLRLLLPALPSRCRHAPSGVARQQRRAADRRRDAAPPAGSAPRPRRRGRRGRSGRRRPQLLPSGPSAAWLALPTIGGRRPGAARAVDARRCRSIRPVPAVADAALRPATRHAERQWRTALAARPCRAAGCELRTAARGAHRQHGAADADQPRRLRPGRPGAAALHRPAAARQRPGGQFPAPARR